MMNDKLSDDGNSYAKMINFHQSDSGCDDDRRRRRSNSFGLPRPSSEQMLQPFFRRNVTAPQYPRNNSMPGSGRKNSDFLSKSSSHEKNHPEQKKQRSGTPSRRRNGSSNSIAQRSSGGLVKSTLLNLEQLCCDEKATQNSLLSALHIVNEHAVDSYYRVIIRKHRGVNILEQTTVTFATYGTVVQLCRAILQRLEQDSSEGKPSLVNGMVVDFHTASPKTVVSRILQDSEVQEQNAAPILTSESTS